MMEREFTNLYDETMWVLSNRGKTVHDIAWVGTPKARINFHKIDEDLKTLFNIDYDAGFGRENINPFLLIVGYNGWWLERQEYDGSEWWEYREFPKMPPKGDVDITNTDYYQLME